MNDILLLLSFCLLCSGCEELFESTVEIEIPRLEEKLVVSSDISSSQDSVLITVSHSQSILDRDDNVKLLQNAVLDLRFDNEDIDLVFDMSTSLYRGILPDLRELVGRQATLRVEHPDFPTVLAETIIPPIPHIENVRYRTDAAKDFDGYDVDELSFDILDVFGENYYFLSAYTAVADTFIFVRPDGDTTIHIREADLVYLDGDGITTERAISGVIFSDARFENQVGKIRVRANQYYEAGTDTKITVLVQGISRDRYFL